MSLISIFCGSPRSEGRSQCFATGLFEEQIAMNPECEVSLISIADMDISGCIGCEGCRETFECVINDDMQELIDYFRDTDEIFIACPIYMAGVPAQFKAVLDRLQPLYWEDARHGELKPAHVHLFGEGHDPYGSKGAEASIRSALHVAGFEVNDVKLHIN